MPEEIKKPAGYVFSIHAFGRSYISRSANKSFLLVWQQRKHRKLLHCTCTISREHYNTIKKMLLPVKAQAERDVGEKGKAIGYIHKTDSRTYMRIKRYLIKEGLLK